jgi:hypothetical protein
MRRMLIQVQFIHNKDTWRLTYYNGRVERLKYQYTITCDV